MRNFRVSNLFHQPDVAEYNLVAVILPLSESAALTGLVPGQALAKEDWPETILDSSRREIRLVRKDDCCPPETPPTVDCTATQADAAAPTPPAALPVLPEPTR